MSRASQFIKRVSSLNESKKINEDYRIEYCKVVRKEFKDGKQKILITDDIHSDGFWIEEITDTKTGKKKYYDENDNPYNPVYVGDKFYGFTYE